MTASAAAGRLYRASPFERAVSLRLPVIWEIGFYAAVFALSTWLRFWDLGSRALHHDESIHAQWSWNLLDYHHSPIFHGPFYYHVQGAVFFLFGSSDYTSRLSAAIFGLGIVALPLLLRRKLGVAGTAATVLFIAFSPTLVYYSRFFREDIYMAFFTLLMAAAMWRYVEEGRERWLVWFALAFTGAMTTKEGTFLVVAAFLVYLDLYLAAQLATQTLAKRDLNTPFRRFVLTGALAPWAWAVAGLWPFLRSLKRRLDWDDDLPRSGDLLVLLMTFTFVLLTPALRHYFLEPLGLLEKDRLNWEQKLQGSISSQDRMALLGIFAMTVSIAAFVGLQWRPKLWIILFGVCGFIYLTLMTSFWNNWDGLVSGPWGSLDYWITQQDVSRGDQPWFYYDLLMPAYEFLPLAVCVAGAWWSIVRGDAFSRFLWVWLVGMWIGLSYGAEKMPWLNTHLALPACVLAGWTVHRAWQAWTDRPALDRAAISLASAAAVSLGALCLVVFMPDGAAFHILRVVIAVVAVTLIIVAARPYGRSAIGAFACAALVGGLALFSIRTMALVTFERGDVPHDMLIYTQSSPTIPDVMDDINRVAELTGKGHQLRILVDSQDSFAWPWAWYLRDYDVVSYVDVKGGLPSGTPAPEYDVLLVHTANRSAVEDSITARELSFTPGEEYEHRWWFDERYKSAMRIGETGADCTANAGNCGPFRLETWKHIFSSTPGWLDTWYRYWRDHDADAIYGGREDGDPRCRSCGSVNAVAYFPGNYVPETGKLNIGPVVVPGPSRDAGGRAVFGSTGASAGQFRSPVDIEQDSQGNLYVIDSTLRRLQKYDAEGNFIAAVSVRKDPANTTEESEPWGLAVGPNGEVAVADTFGWRVRIFDSDLTFTGVEFGTPPADGAPGPFNLFGPRDLAFDAEGNLWVTDTGHKRIQVYTPGGEFLRTIGSEGSGDGQFNEPVGISIASDGTVFVADMYNRRVVMLGQDGAFKGSFPVEGWGGQEVVNKPYIEALTSGNLAVSLPLENDVRIYARDGTVVAALASATDPLDVPYGILEVADAKLWVVESGSGRVRQFSIP